MDKTQEMIAAAVAAERARCIKLVHDCHLAFRTGSPYRQGYTDGVRNCLLALETQPRERMPVIPQPQPGRSA